MHNLLNLVRFLPNYPVMGFSFAKDYKSAIRLLNSQDAYIEQRFGDSSIVFSSPHARRFTRRDGRLKPGEPSTGQIGVVLAKYSLATCLIQNQGDMLEVFRCRLKNDFPKHMLVDLHGMKDIHAIDICLGIGLPPNLESQQAATFFQTLLESYGFSVRINFPFEANKLITLTKYFQSLGNPAVQIEIARYIRDSEVLMEKFCLAIQESCRLLAIHKGCGKN